jgi:hypothetical protein
MDKLSYTRNGNEYSIAAKSDATDAIALVADSFGVPPATVAYLLQYGFKQSLQDAAAQPASEASKESGATESSIKSAIHGAMSKRLDNIVAGTVAVRGGGSRSPFAELTRDVIDEYLAKWATKSGAVLPTKSADLNAYRVKMYESANKASIDAEIATRRAKMAAIDVVDFDM